MIRQERDLSSFSLRAAGVASSTVTQDFFFFFLTDDSLKNEMENVLVDRYYFKNINTDFSFIKCAVPDLARRTV
jgi:hypothetical protein